MASFDEAIPPGQEGSIQVKVKTSHLRGLSRRTVTVTSNDPESPKTNLIISLEVVGSVNILPTNRIVLNDTNERYRQVKLLVSKDETETGELVISDLVASTDLFTATARPVVEGESFGQRKYETAPGDWVIEAQLAGEAGAGTYRGTLKFKTALPREPEITLPVTITAPPFVQVSKRPVVLQEPAPGESVTTSFTATLRSKVEPEQVKVSVTPETFRIKTEQGATPSTLNVSLSMEAQEGEPPLHGRILFTYEGRQFVVPVRVMKRNPAPR